MLGKRRAGWVLRLVLADGVALVLAFLAAWGVRSILDPALPRGVGPLGYYAWLVAVILPIWLGVLAGLGAYDVGWVDRSRAWLALRASAIGIVVLTTGLYLGRAVEINRSLLGLLAATSLGSLWGERELVRGWLGRRGRGDPWARVVLVVGTDERAARLVDALRRYPEAGWRVIGCLKLSPSQPEAPGPGVPILGALSDLPSILEAGPVVDEVFFVVPPGGADRLTEALEVCEGLGVDTRVLVDHYRPAHAQAFVEELFGLPFYGFSPTLTRLGALAVKRGLEVVIAAVLLAALSPLMLGIGLFVRLTSRGPAVFRQERVGFHGRRFTMYKFRTMVEGAEQRRPEVGHLNVLTGPVFKAARDPRVTPVGRVLRRWSLDELPQLVNVLRGEMSLVGPRPLPVYEAERVKGAQRRRLAMRPGLTGLWQVSGRSAPDFDEWIRLDLQYVDRWSLGLDLRILLRTIPSVVLGEGAR